LFRGSSSALICPHLEAGRVGIAERSPTPFSFRICLHSTPTGVIDVVTVITAKGDHMTTSITEETGTAPATATGAQPKPTKKARVAKRARNVAPAKGKSGKKASPAKKAPKVASGASPKPKATRPGKAAKEKSVREGSKTETILELLKRPGGATAKELQKATSWLPHSVRGFLSGTIRKKMGLDVVSTKTEDGERSYSVKS
jgi:hypothetical protein